MFYKSPTSLIFKGPVFSEVTADVCGHCGHVELRIADPEKLYDAYLTAKSTGPSADTEPQVEDWDDLGWDCPECGSTWRTTWRFAGIAAPPRREQKILTSGENNARDQDISIIAEPCSRFAELRGQDRKEPTLAQARGSG